jgi:hypothetical protein
MSSVYDILKCHDPGIQKERDRLQKSREQRFGSSQESQLLVLKELTLVSADDTPRRGTPRPNGWQKTLSDSKGRRGVMKIIANSMIGLMVVAALTFQANYTQAAPKSPVLKVKCVCFCGSTKVVLDGINQIAQCRAQNDKGCYPPGENKRKGLTKCNMSWAKGVPKSTIITPPKRQLQKK